MALIAAALAGCGPHTAASTTALTTLTIGVDGPPLSLNPAKDNNGASQWFVDLAYLSVIDTNASGDPIPGISSSWKMAPGNKSIALTIDTSLKFADGTSVTAAAVANSLNYFAHNATGPSSATYKTISAAVTGTDQVTVRDSLANPELVEVLTPLYLGGDIISAAGLAHPASLSTGTYGAGPYVLDASQTIPDVSYTYLPNPHYPNSKIHFKKVVIKVFSGTSSMVLALDSGQIDVMEGDTDTVATARSSGAYVAYRPADWNGIILTDRDGQTTPALKSVEVRQALNYAINRQAIAAAVGGQYTASTDQPNSGGNTGYDSSLNSYYTYNVAKAKRLLADAGYPNGFTMKVNYTSAYSAVTLMVQAVSQELSQIGVRVELTADANPGALIKDMYSKKFAGSSLPFGGNAQALNWPILFLPGAPMNPFDSTSPTISAAYQAVVTASPSAEANAADAAERAVVQLAWALPVIQTDNFIYASKNLTGVSLVPGGVSTNPRLWRPASS